MGLRNPFRSSVNRTNGHVYMADYSPDAPVANPLRGPAGHGRWMLIRKPGNYGWPFCVTLDMPYIDYDFATGESGEPFDCLRPVNDSALNIPRGASLPVPVAVNAILLCIGGLGLGVGQPMTMSWLAASALRCTRPLVSSRS